MTDGKNRIPGRGFPRLAPIEDEQPTGDDGKGVVRIEEGSVYIEEGDKLAMVLFKQRVEGQIDPVVYVRPIMANDEAVRRLMIGLYIAAENAGWCVNKTVDELRRTFEVVAPRLRRVGLEVLDGGEAKSPARGSTPDKP